MRSLLSAKLFSVLENQTNYNAYLRSFPTPIHATLGIPVFSRLEKEVGS